MQMALAVNSALMALIKLQIFCTEPFRIPLAGRVDVCMFDKTGTITTDQLTAIGVVGSGDRDGGKDDTAHTIPDPADSFIAETGAVRPPHKMIEAPIEAAIVLGGCHSLVQIDGKVLGDPVEEASLKGIDFTYQPGFFCAVAIDRPPSLPTLTLCTHPLRDFRLHPPSLPTHRISSVFPERELGKGNTHLAVQC